MSNSDFFSRQSARKARLAVLTVCAALSLVACGGGGGGDSDGSLIGGGGGSSGADTLAPSISIESPANNGSAIVNQTTISVAGRASDNVALRALAWSSNRGGNGPITVSQNWRTSDITLRDGDNLITVTAEDVAGNKNSDSINIVFRASGDGSQDATAMISYQSDLSNPSLLDGATVPRRFAYLFFEPGSRWNSLGVRQVEFYCCKALTGQASDHLPRVIDSAAPFALGIDLSQFEAGTRRELYIDVVYNDGSRGSQRVEFDLQASTSGPNSSPTIGGNPPGGVIAGQNYSFIPTASDPDGDLLTFSIQNRPVWASFNTATGQLSGTPDNGDVGTYSNVRISVSDGSDSASLAAFTISVDAIANSAFSVGWTPPTEREDGSALDGISGYRIFYGRQSGVYENRTLVNQGGITEYTVDNVSSGTWYVAVTAIDNNGLESALSNEVIKQAN